MLNDRIGFYRDPLPGQFPHHLLSLFRRQGNQLNLAGQRANRV